MNRDRSLLHSRRDLSSNDKQAPSLQLVRGALFKKYFTLIIAVLASVLTTSSLIELWYTFQSQREALIRIQREQAVAAAARISQFVEEIEGQLGWLSYIPWEKMTREQRELDTLRLLRQVPAITELTHVDANGRERLHVSRQAIDRIDSFTDWSKNDAFLATKAGKTYFGPVYFRRETEPYMTVAVPGVRQAVGVSIAEVNLKHIWDVVNTIRVGSTGKAYVVDSSGRLIAHPDISLVLRNTDFSALPQVRAAQRSPDDAANQSSDVVRNIEGDRVITVYADAKPMNWLVFVELPEKEANIPLNAAILRSSITAMAGLGLALLAALLLARRMVIPIRRLTAGAERIGAGGLNHRIAIQTGDELQTLGEQFNTMASQLQASYETLERKVEERTQQLQLAILSKSRFLAAASHDLRQPLHALTLLVAQLPSESDPNEVKRLTQRIESAAANMNELFNALLDISRLDAGAMHANITDFPVNVVLKHVEATFAAAALEKGLHLSVLPCRAWVRSDAILLERILLNLASNAIRYTDTGGVVIGCRRKNDHLRIDVYDSGAGISPSQKKNIFAEFYRGDGPQRMMADGLGLGLAIVDRLGTLLDHPVEVVSTQGIGSRFSVTVPRVNPVDTDADAPSLITSIASDPMSNKLVVVIDDDFLVLDGTRGLLKSWGCRVVASTSVETAIRDLGTQMPDLIISDFQLKGDEMGINAIAKLRQRFAVQIPAFLISGDLSKELLDTARRLNLPLLHKPVDPLALRAMMSRQLLEKVEQ